MAYPKFCFALGFVVDRKRKRDRDRESLAAGETQVVFTYDSAGNVINSDTTAAAPAGRSGTSSGPRTGSRGGGGNQHRNAAGTTGGAAGGGGLHGMGGAGTADLVAALQGDAYLAIEGAEPLLDLRTVLPELDGPSVVCQQPWASFMESRSSQEQQSVAHRSSAAAYMEDLEMRTDAFGAVIPPKSFRCRCRVGRGGRLVLDRIPVKAICAPKNELAFHFLTLSFFNSCG